MAVRKTESRLPASFAASDLGEAVVTADARCALISFVTSPLVVGRENVYLVYVTDNGLASATQSFEWSISENGGPAVVETTEPGEFAYVPAAAGSLSLTARVLGGGNAELATVSLTQDIVDPNVELETLITSFKNQPGPLIANTDVARELINDHNPYYQGVGLQTPETDDSFQRFVFDIVFDGALQRTPAARKTHLEDLAASLNAGASDFAALSGKGAGISGIRLPVLAMMLPDMLPFTELPEPVDQRAVAEEELRDALAALTEEKRIDLFNLVRCPKSNITRCAQIIEGLRDHYFPGTNFKDVVTGMSGTRAVWIARHFREGPLLHT